MSTRTECSVKRDGNWMDESGACKVCDGEIPHGHSGNCDIYKLEHQVAELAALKRERDELREALSELLRADERPPTMRQASDAKLAMAKARLVLARTEPKP